MSSNLVHRLRTWSSKQIFTVFAAFLVYVLADGTTFSFGLYVEELNKEYSTFNRQSVIEVSILAALIQSIPLLLSPLVCLWTTKFGAGTASLIGCVLSASGYILPYVSQFGKTFWGVSVGYGFLLSVGLAFCYVPAYLTIPVYFDEDRGLATGLAVSGSGVGQVTLAILVKACILEYQWRGASLITGGLFLFMLVAVLAFQQPTSRSSSPDIQTVPSPVTEVTDTLVVPSTRIVVSDENAQEPEVLIEQPYVGRSRGMTLAQVLPLFISSVPVRSGLTVHPVEPSPTRRHSLTVRPRNLTIAADTSAVHTEPSMQVRRNRSNTIAVPLQTMQKLDRSLEQLRPPFRSSALAPIASMEENSEEDDRSSLAVPEEIIETDQTSNEKHWLLNKRFLLFCFSNFALCFVMGVPYVILPTHVSETFLDHGYLASWALSNVGIASALGQVLLGYLHDRKIFDAWLMYTVAVIISGISLIILALFRYKFIVLICGFMFGLAISANYALQMLIVIDALSMDNMASAFGMLQFFQGISTLIGIPIQGLLRYHSTSYKMSFLTSGFIIILSGVSMFLWPCFNTNKQKKINNLENNP